MNERCAHARVVGPVMTYVKHEFALTDGFAEVKRAGEVLATLSGATGVFDGLGKNRTGRIEGVNSDGVIEVWSVTCSCGCGETARQFQTDEMYVPR